MIDIIMCESNQRYCSQRENAGCEWRTYLDWIKGGIDLRQVYIEVHNFPPIANKMFQDIHDEGYAIFHKVSFCLFGFSLLHFANLTCVSQEPNIQWGGGNCVEYSFLKLHKDYFV